MLKARVRAAPEKGNANAALEKLVAKWLGLRKTAVTLVSGGASRLKSVEVAGDADELARRIARLPGAVGPMIIACLLRNTLQAACTIRGLAMPAICTQS